MTLRELLQSVDAAASVSNEIEVKTIRFYDMQYREEHWEQDLQRAFDAGKRMAEKII